MISLMVALPLLFAFFLSLISTFKLDKKFAKPLFIAGSLIPWLFLLISLKSSPFYEIVGGWSREGGIEIGLNDYNLYFLLAELIVFSAAALYSLKYFTNNTGKVYALLLLMHAGLIGSFISKDFFNYYIYMEIASVSAFALVGISEEKHAKTAAFKYLIFSLLASYLFIFAIGIIYLKTGYLNAELIKENLIITKEIDIALVIAFISLILKAGIFPLYFWLPDAHAKAPNPISALLSGIVVKSPIYGMLLIHETFSVNANLMMLLRIIAFASVFFGIVLMILQRNVKRLLAYSTVSQMGYILLSLSINSTLGVIYYSFAHSLFKSGLFLSAGALIDSQKSKNLKKLTYRGEPLLMVSILGLSLAIGGISPFVGSYAKNIILKGLTDYWVYLFYIANVGTLTSFIKMNYYLAKPKEVKAKSRSLYKALSFIMMLLTLTFGIYFGAEIKLISDVLSIGIALILFVILKRFNVFEIELKPKFERSMKGIAEEINFYAGMFGIVFLIFLLLSFF